MREWFSASELAGLPGMPATHSAVIRLSKRNRWDFQHKSGRGGGREYHIASLSAETRAHLATTHLSGADVDAGAAEARKLDIVARVGQAAERRTRTYGLARAAALRPADRARLAAKRRILILADDYRRAAQLPLRDADLAFARAYTTGALEVDEATRAAVRRVSASTLRAWRRRLQTEGDAALAGRYGNRRGTSRIDRTPEIHDFILAMVHDNPHVMCKGIYRGLKARFAADLRPSKRALQRWLKRWKREHAELYQHILNPDRWRSRYQAAGGNAAEAITALNQLWEMDSTPGDVLLADGHRHALIGVIDVQSRRLKFHVSRTSRSTAISALLRRAILEWGVPDTVSTDEGSDYTSLHVRRAFSGLDTHHHICRAFTPEDKPFIERAFGTFCRDLVELLHGYIGHDVAGRKNIEARRSFADRLMKRGEEPAELRLTPEEFQAFCDAWCDQVYGMEPHSGLDGKAPLEVAASWPHPIRRIDDARALDILLSEAPGDGHRTVTKKGIRIDGALFDSPALGEMAGKRVRVLLDETDHGSIYVFDGDTGAFVCQAVCPERTGISRKEVATHRKQKQKALIAEQRKELKAIARRVDTTNIVSEILAERAAAAGKLAYFPQRSIDHTTPELEAAGEAARRAAPSARPLDDDERAAQARIAEQLRSGRGPHEPEETLDQRARRWDAIRVRIERGERVTDDEYAFYEGWRDTPECRAYERMRVDLGWRASEAN